MVLLTAKVIEKISIPDALLLSLVGFCVVFIALIAIIAIIKIITALSGGKQSKTVTAGADGPVAVIPASAPVSAASNKVPAVGSLGDIDLHTVNDATAAMLMAIVADDLKAPLNTLRFTSIRQIGEEK